jgi:hypothetical protein
MSETFDTPKIWKKFHTTEIWKNFQIDKNLNIL